MSYTNQTTHYGLPLPTQTDLVNGLDNNDAFERIDTAIYGAEQAATTATQDIIGIKATIAQLQNADVTFQSELTGVKARVSTLEENETTVVEDIQDTQDMITAREVAQAQSDIRILVGEWFRYNGVLYKCTAQIELGDTIVPNVNCSATNVETEVASGGTVSVDADDVVYDNTSSGLSATNVQDAIDETSSIFKVPEYSDTRTLVSGSAAPEDGFVNVIGAAGPSGGTMTLSINSSQVYRSGTPSSFTSNIYYSTGCYPVKSGDIITFSGTSVTCHFYKVR